MKQALSVAIVIALVALPASAADPDWWAERGVKSTSASSNLSPANIGQAKHMASMALAELEGILSPADHQSLVAGVSAVVNLQAPVPAEQREAQRAPLLNGQLKAIAKPFYDTLRSVDPAWLATQMEERQLRVLEPGSNPPAYSPYPWSVAATDDSNFAPASVGQLKAVFSLDFSTLSVTEIDSDGDGLSDAWEIENFGSLSQDASGDPDSDGASNIQEFLAGSDPNNPDTDGDGIIDGFDGNPVSFDGSSSSPATLMVLTPQL